MNRDVAVKSFFQPIRDERGQRKFDHERKTLGQFSGNRGIVDVHTAGRDSHQRPFLIMGYYDGGSLESVLAGGETLSAQQTVHLGRQVAQALSVVHRSNLVHRDIKPANILLSASGEAALGDFGISGADNNLAASQISAMTPMHGAPEVQRNGGGSAQSDVWSLASTLYTALLGRAPFERTDPGQDTHIDLSLRIMSDPLPRLSGSSVPAALNDALARAMDKDPKLRTPSAQAFDDDLAAVQRAQGWLASAAETPRRPTPLKPFDPGATGTALGARMSETPLPQTAMPASPAPVEPAPRANATPGRFDGKLTAASVTEARHIPLPTDDDEPQRHPRNTKRDLVIAGAGILILFVGVSIYGAVDSRHSPKADATTTPIASGAAPVAAAPQIPSHVHAVARGDTVTISWTGTTPASAFGAVVSDGTRTWAAPTAGHLTLTEIPSSKQGCYSVSWVIDSKGTTHYSKPACVAGASPSTTP